MIFCQVCQTANSLDAQACSKCGTKLLVMNAKAHWEEIEVPRISLEDHLIERISAIEEAVNGLVDHVNRMSESVLQLDNNALITKSGLKALIELLQETNLVREDLLHRRWESSMQEQLVADRIQERYQQMKDRFLALYRGKEIKRSSFEALVEEAEFQLYADRLMDATENLKRALKLDPKNYELAYYIADFYHDQGLITEAEKLLKKALRANPDHTDSLLMLALICYSESRTDEAQELLQRCLTLNNRDDLAKICLASILIGENQMEVASDLLEQVNDSYPQPQSYYLLGIIAKEQGRLGEAIDCLEYAIELDPEHEEAVFALGMAFLERGWSRKAKACFARALELNPKRLEYQEVVPAEEQAQVEVLELDSDGQATLDQANNFLAEGKPGQALPHFRKLIRRFPSNPSLLTTYGLVNLSMRRYEESLRITSDILALQVPENVATVAYNIRVESLRALRRFEEALETLETMLKKFESGLGQVIAYCGTAMTLADLGQNLKKAESLGLKALDFCPPEYRHQVLDALGWVYFKQGRYEEALELLEAALNMTETLGHLYHYGMILLALNLQDKAAKIFERTAVMRKSHAQIDKFIFEALRGGEMGAMRSNQESEADDKSEDQG